MATTALSKRGGQLAKSEGSAIDLSVSEKVLIEGDLSVLSPEERIEYYSQVCQSAGLNPITRPFLYVTLNGKLTLYPKKDCAEQLRRVHSISLSKPDIQFEDGLIIVTIEAKDRSGKTDTDIGAVSMGSLQGEAKANAVMKAITKAKRRVTFSICGLGFLPDMDEEQVQQVERNQNTRYQESDLWMKVTDLFRRSDSEDKVQQAEAWAYKRIEDGKLPQIARNAIEREAAAARDRITSLTAGIGMVDEPIEAEYEETEAIEPPTVEPADDF